MFGRDVYIPTPANLLQPKLRYLADKFSFLSIEMLREVCMLAVMSLKWARKKQPSKKTKELPE